MKPIPAPHRIERMIRCFSGTLSIASLVVMTGLTMNFTPSISVMNSEKLPIVCWGTLLATQLPTMVKTSTVIIMTRPFLTSRFLFFP